MKTKTQINTIVKTNTIWTSSDMTKFIVSKVQKKSGKIWIFYHLLNDKSKKFFCYEEAFIHRFYQFDNLIS